MQQIIRFVEKIDELDLGDTEPLLHMSEHSNILREDVVSGSVNPEDALKNAPVHDDKYFIVPKVIKK